jgi:hypothetical protein
MDVLRRNSRSAIICGFLEIILGLGMSAFLPRVSRDGSSQWMAAFLCVMGLVTLARGWTMREAYHRRAEADKLWLIVEARLKALERREPLKPRV